MLEGQTEKSPLHPAMFSKFVEIDEKSFNLNAYAEELHQFEELLEEYSGTAKTTDKDYFADTDGIISTALSLKSGSNLSMEAVSLHRNQYVDSKFVKNCTRMGYKFCWAHRN